MNGRSNWEQPVLVHSDAAKRHRRGAGPNLSDAAASRAQVRISSVSLNVGSAVKTTHDRPVVGSAHAAVPYDPLCPNASIDGPEPNLKSCAAIVCTTAWKKKMHLQRSAA